MGNKQYVQCRSNGVSLFSAARGTYATRWCLIRKYFNVSAGVRLQSCLHNKLTLLQFHQITSDSQVGRSDGDANIFFPPCRLLCAVTTCRLRLRREHHFNTNYFLRSVKDLAGKIFLSSDNYTKWTLGLEPGAIWLELT